MVARIYRPAKTAMQSGKAKTNRWVLDYEPEVQRSIEPLMGYTSSSDMNSQLRLTFESKEEAIAYAERKNIPFRIQEAKDSRTRTMAYSDNFKFDRGYPWTH